MSRYCEEEKKIDYKTIQKNKIIEKNTNPILEDEIRITLKYSNISDNNSTYLNNKTDPYTPKNITEKSEFTTIKKERKINENSNELICHSNADGHNFVIKNKKIFKIKKYVKYNKYLSELCSDEAMSDNEKFIFEEAKFKKISPFSKVNFSKLNGTEKDERLKNLAKLVKRLRRKLKNIENKFRFNTTKLLNKYLWKQLRINSKNKFFTPEFEFDFDKICKSLKKVKNFQEFEFDDQKHLIENIINLVADEKLKLDSIQYKKICSILRTIIPKEKIKFISKKDTKISISFPESEFFITNKEYMNMGKHKDNKEVLRAVLGLENSDSDSNVNNKYNLTEGEKEYGFDQNFNKNSESQADILHCIKDKFPNFNQEYFINQNSNINISSFINNLNDEISQILYMKRLYDYVISNSLFNNYLDFENFINPVNYNNYNNNINNFEFNQTLFNTYRNIYSDKIGNNDNHSHFLNINNTPNLSNISLDHLSAQNPQFSSRNMNNPENLNILWYIQNYNGIINCNPNPNHVFIK